MKKIAVMTGGGDCPGLNAAVRAVVLTGLQYNQETLGIRNGWKGLIDGDLQPLSGPLSPASSPGGEPF